MERRQPAVKVPAGSRQQGLKTIRTTPASRLRPVSFVDTSDSVAPIGGSMEHKSVPLLIKSADDDSAPSPVWPRSSTTSTTTVMLFVEMPSASHSVAAHTATAGVNGQGR